MLKLSGFYERAVILVVSLMFITLLAGYLCFKQTLVADRLLPASESALPWSLVVSSDAEKDGQSTIQMHGAEQSLDYTFFLSDAIEYGYASVAMRFNSDNQSNGFVDLSKYLRLRFKVQCDPINTLSLTVYTFDDKLTDVNSPETYRMPTAFFPCDGDWGVVDVDLQHMEIPEWWLNLHKVTLSDREYQLSQTSRFSFGVSLQSPKNALSSVKIADIELVGRDWRYMYAFLVFALVFWLVLGYWLSSRWTKVFVANLEERIQKGKPLIAYQRVSLEPHRNKEKSAVLDFMAAEYFNPDMSLEMATSAIGIGKAKINSILKNETGLTFSAYLNKLRLAEAARLLSEKPEANVSVIALSVGYNNVSYFNKLFKNEYGASPKAFRSAYLSKSNP